MTDHSEVKDTKTTKIHVASKTMSIAEAQRTVESSGTWFWWIAGLSAVNSIAVMLKLQYSMLLGLGIGQIIDAIFLSMSADPSMLARGFHIALSASVAGIFVTLGYYARRFSSKAFVIGIILYALDALIFVFTGDWVAVGFHGFVLFMLWGGFSVLSALQAQIPNNVRTLA